MSTTVVSSKVFHKGRKQYHIDDEIYELVIDEYNHLTEVPDITIQNKIVDKNGAKYTMHNTWQHGDV